MGDLLTGDGSGYGHGYGHGYGDGSGYGHGDGSGYVPPDGSGYGHGYGYGYVLPDIAGYTVCVPWPGLLCIGCQNHSLDHWRQHWRDIAREHGEDVDEAEMLALLSQAETVTIHDIFPP